ncbi:MAG: hypothetical protein F6K30_17705 [Cyanothece sp. SIO2G6]|nr:hypothetical protein [Cyanothece sp. SIO2G6]
MNRLPRRPPRRPLPLRGRLAAIPLSNSGQARSTVAIASASTGPKRRKRKRSTESACSPPADLANLYQALAKLYLQWPGLFHLLDHPWKWGTLVIVIILIFSALGRLLWPFNY